jgi:hypothetical protein
MPTVVTTSKKFTINLRDASKGLLVAVLSPVFTIALNSLNAGSLTFDWKAIGTTALAAGLGYLMKNYFTPSATVTTVTPPVTGDK